MIGHERLSLLNDGRGGPSGALTTISGYKPFN